MGSLQETHSSSQPNISIIDFAPFLSPTSTQAERLEVAQSLVSACHSVGFVFIINHGVSPSLLDEAFAWSEKLFSLSTDEKMLAPHPDGPTVHRGYSWPGLEKVSQVISEDMEVGEKLREVVDCKESYEIGSETNDEQPNVWLPEPVLPAFRAFMTSFYWTLSSTSLEILRALGLGLGLQDPDFLLQFHSGHNNQLRLLHYPPIAAAALESESAARMPAHSDWGSITMLFQDDCGGLEVQRQDLGVGVASAGEGAEEEFVKVTPLKNALVMNVGDLLMRWSNDHLKSTLHRVTLPPLSSRYTGTERMTRARYSIPYFVSPDIDAVVKVMDECAGPEKPVKYEPVVQREYRLMRAKLQYPQKETLVV